MNIEIEKAKKEDLKECAYISVTSWQETYRNIVNQEYLANLNIEKRQQKFESNYQTSPFIVAKIDNKVVGFCIYIINTEISKFPEIDSELTVLYVNPKLKNQGIGTKLFQYVVHELQKENKHNMLICCLKGNTIGENFYKKMHGQIIGENEIEIGDHKYPELAFKFNI